MTCVKRKKKKKGKQKACFNGPFSKPFSKPRQITKYLARRSTQFNECVDVTSTKCKHLLKVFDTCTFGFIHDCKSMSLLIITH